VITDPFFYAVALPAAVLIGLSKSGFAGGFAALAVPLMALAVPVPQAAAILLPVLCVADVLGLTALLRERDRALVRLLVPAGLGGIALGALTFRLLSTHAVAALIGAITLVFLALRTLFPPHADAPPPPRWLGRALGVLSGYTSFVAHAGGPPLGFYLLPQRLPPLTFAATTAVFFAAVNLAKWLPYALLGLIDLRNMLSALLLLPAVPLGVWLGVRFVRRVPATLFYRLFNLGMLVTGCKLLWDGLR
jgi:uncharacterized membrane protein YfcA